MERVTVETRVVMVMGEAVGTSGMFTTFLLTRHWILLCSASVVGWGLIMTHLMLGLMQTTPPAALQPPHSCKTSAGHLVMMFTST